MFVKYFQSQQKSGKYSSAKYEIEVRIHRYVVSREPKNDAAIIKHDVGSVPVLCSRNAFTSK